ncbi:MAG: coproporphyrinogen III oxidase family protein [Deltaproteobacteria bacterium]|nr:coproporphyrinogen III oxidase family protein [Deltaproteobacteria bacterium]
MKYKTSQYFTFEHGCGIDPPMAPAEPVHLYVHIPFCVQLCPYCSFHRVSYDQGLARQYFHALKQELQMYHDLGFRFRGVYIGGGTPTIDMDELTEVLSLIRKLFSPEEISIETNPDRLDGDTLVRLAEGGVKRVSVGVQSFNDDILRDIVRYEKYGGGLALQEKLLHAKGYVDTLNVDMIYNFPSQTSEMFEGDLAVLKEVKPDQITFYPLMISDATRAKMEHLMGRVSYKQEKLFYQMITSHLENLYQPSSAWCFSRKGTSMIDEYIVVSSEYVGVGSGAFGLIGGSIYANTFSLENYIARIADGMLPLSAKKVFSKKEMARYTFLMDLFGLRLDLTAFKKRFGAHLFSMLAWECLFFRGIGGIRIHPGSIELTRRGRYYWVTMMREFFIGVDNFRDFSREAAGIEI